VELLARETHELGKATIMVTHDERLIKYCDKVYEMRDGVLKLRRKAKV
jgi:putative ABC transport system ATP-binding protein